MGVPAYIKLENSFADYCGRAKAVTCSSGTAALHLALEALRLRPGSLVAVPEFTMISTAWAVQYAGLTPVFVDCGSDLLIDTEKLERELFKYTAFGDPIRAVMPVHIYGRVCDMVKIAELAENYNLRVVEDACEAHGAPGVGELDLAAYSFYQNKIIASEEGGAVTTDCPDDAEYIADIKNMGFGDSHDYLHAPRGFNYRMPNAQAELALVSLANVEQNQKRRKQVAEHYDALLPDWCRRPSREVVWVYDIRHPRAKFLANRLQELGVAARPAFRPMSSQPTFKRSGALGGGQGADVTSLKAWEASKGIMYLPVHPKMTLRDVTKICDLLMEIPEFHLR